MILVKQVTKQVGMTILGSGLLLALHTTHASQAPERDDRYGLFIDQVQSLYEIDEESAIERLAKEEIASELAVHIESLNLQGYAGSWFDAEKLTLVVALNDDSLISVVENLGADVKLVEFSLNELDATRTSYSAALEKNLESTIPFRISYVDIMNNRVVFGVSPDQMASAISLAASRNYGPDIVVEESYAAVMPSSGNIRGANGQQNLTWGAAYICSIGVSVTGGYYTAGHCGLETNLIGDPSGTQMGQVEGSTYTAGTDSGFVSTLTGWNPQPYVNGYNDGLLAIPARFSGTVPSAVNTTVCRYGQTSQFADCGTIVSKNVNTTMQGYAVNGITEVTGMCSSNGDSGGPYLSPSSHIQGTNMGWHATLGTMCPGSGNTFFMPISDHIEEFGNSQTQILSVHGSNAPSIADFSCSPQGGSMIACTSAYNSQGETSMVWRINGVVAGSGTSKLFYCTTGQTETLQVTATNTYGSGSQSANVFCHGGPVW